MKASIYPHANIFWVKYMTI